MIGLKVTKINRKILDALQMQDLCMIDRKNPTDLITTQEEIFAAMLVSSLKLFPSSNLSRYLETMDGLKREVGTTTSWTTFDRDQGIECEISDDQANLFLKLIGVEEEQKTKEQVASRVLHILPPTDLVSDGAKCKNLLDLIKQYHQIAQEIKPISGRNINIFAQEEQSELLAELEKLRELRKKLTEEIEEDKKQLKEVGFLDRRINDYKDVSDYVRNTKVSKITNNIGKKLGSLTSKAWGYGKKMLGFDDKEEYVDPFLKEKDVNIDTRINIILKEMNLKLLQCAIDNIEQLDLVAKKEKQDTPPSKKDLLIPENKTITVDTKKASPQNTPKKKSTNKPKINIKVDPKKESTTQQVETTDKKETNEKEKNIPQKLKTKEKEEKQETTKKKEKEKEKEKNPIITVKKAALSISSSVIVVGIVMGCSALFGVALISIIPLTIASIGGLAAFILPLIILRKKDSKNKENNKKTNSEKSNSKSEKKEQQNQKSSEETKSNTVEESKKENTVEESTVEENKKEENKKESIIEENKKEESKKEENTVEENKKATESEQDTTKSTKETKETKEKSSEKEKKSSRSVENEKKKNDKERQPQPSTSINTNIKDATTTAAFTEKTKEKA